MSTGEAGTTLLRSARLYVSKGSSASLDGGSRVAGELSSTIRLGRNVGGFIADIFLIKFDLALVDVEGEVESLLDSSFLFNVVEETD